MKSRLIKFACHQCGTKLAVPPEMAGVSDLCPKCGTMITAPQESTLDPVRKKSKLAPTPKEGELYAPESQPQPEHAHPTPPQPHQPEVPAVPGWSASELADALRPPTPAPVSYVPQQPSPALKGLLPDPPAIPDPGPVFTPKRKARTEGESAGSVVVAPAPPVAKSEHPILGSILDAPTIPRGRGTPQAPDSAPNPEALAPAPPLPPGPLEPPLPPQLEVAPAPPAPTSVPAPELAWGELEPQPETQPPTPPAIVAEAPPQADPSAAESTSEQTSILTEAPASTEPSEPQAHAPFSAAPVVQSSPIALVPESLPDARAAEEAAMPGMGEVLAGDQVAQDQPAPPETRDHRPLLNVPFLPVAVSPKKERRQLKRKLYILGAILFIVFDIGLAFVLLRAKPEAANEGADSKTPNATPTAENPAATTQAPRPAGSPSIAAPDDFASTTPQSSGATDPKKPTTPPRAIPLPGHSGTDVPTATPATEPAPAALAASSAPEKEKEQEGKKPDPAMAAATVPKDSATSAPPSPAATTAELNPSMVALMGPQPPPATAPTGVSGDPPWLKRIQPTFPAIDGTPLLPSAPQEQAQPQAQTKTEPQPMSPPPPLPPPPGAAPTPSPAPAPTPATAETAAPAPAPAPSPTTPPPAPPEPAPAMTAASPTPAPNPETAPAAPKTDTAATATTSANASASGATPPTTTTPPDSAPPPANTSELIGKLPDEAQGALTTLRNFLAAPNWEARAAYVQKPEETKPAMEKHAKRYGDGPVNPSTIKFVDRHPGKDGGPPYCMFELAGGDLKHNVLVLVEQPKEGQALVDWATFVEFKDDLLLKFLETQGEPNQSFRVMLSRKHYFSKDVPDLASKDSFQVQQPNDAFDGHVFLPKSTALSKKLATQLGWNQNMPVIVELAWRTNGKLHWVEIVRIVNYGWRG